MDYPEPRRLQSLTWMVWRPGRLQASAMSSFDLTRHSTRPMKSANVAPQDPARNCVSWKVHLQPAAVDMAADDTTDSAQTTSCSSFHSAPADFTIKHLCSLPHYASCVVVTLKWGLGRLIIAVSCLCHFSSRLTPVPSLSPAVLSSLTHGGMFFPLLILSALCYLE